MPGVAQIRANKDSKSFFAKMRLPVMTSKTSKNAAGAPATKATEKRNEPHSGIALEDHCAASRNPDHGMSFEIGSLRSLPHHSTIYELLPGKLYMTCHPTQEFTLSEIKRRPDLFYFSTDLHERYIPFCKDFGPVSVGIMSRFIQYVRSKEHHPCLRGRPLVYYTDKDEKTQANAAVLLGAYMMLEHGMSAKMAARVFEANWCSPFPAFRDATYQNSDFGITLEDCLRGLERAMKVGWFDKHSFDVQQFEELEDPRNGDVSLIGDKFLAFRGPKLTADHDQWVCPPAFYSSKFKELGVTAVIRLNEPDCYDKEDFEKDGIAVHDLEFADCTCPSPTLVKKFLDVVDSCKGRVAVHCKAGLGRTGTMIGLWMMKNLGFSAREAIAWLRLCRPGCVLGQQQHFLAACDKMIWEDNTIIPATSPSLSRRASSAASGAITPLASLSLSGSSGSMGRAPSAGQAAVPESEELGRQIEQASRNRMLLRQGAA